MAWLNRLDYSILVNYVFVAEDPICYMDLIRVMERSLYGILNTNMHNEEIKSVYFSLHSKEISKTNLA